MLCETWTSKFSIIDKPGFEGFALHREKQSKRSRRNSGGLIVYVKTALSNGVTLLKQGPSELVWLKISKDYFGIPNDIMLCLCYVVPSNATGQRLVEYDIFDQIVLDMSDLSERYKNNNIDFIICGDMNGRTATVCDYVEEDRGLYVPLPDDYIHDDTLPRCNMDVVVNDQGRRILELCKMCNLRIVNGRVGAGRCVGK